MTSLIKNQILKKLSVFAHGITPSQISVEVLRGKGELRNVILNEKILSEKLELPGWLRIKHASCNRVTVKIPWTQLATRPVELYVDEIRVTLELCADDIEEYKNRRSSSSPNSYGFGDKVIEGLSIFVNTVEIEFTSSRFRGSIMLSRLEVESLTPRWEKTNDLKNTRFSDPITQKIMNFKCVSWQLLRIEARSIEGDADTGEARKGFSSPLRLITNNGKCRITIKKSHVDGSLICGRMQTILEEVLWIVTLPQLRSAISFGKHILELVKKSAEPSNSPEKNFTKTLNEENRSMSKRYEKIDFNQSSNHLYVTKMDLHLYDDGSESNFPPDWNIDNGAIQLVLLRVSVDVYPSHAPLWKRTDWVGYDTANPCSSESDKLVAMHLTKISEGMDEDDKKLFSHVYKELRSQNIVIRVNDLILYRVSQQSSKKESLVPLISSDSTARQTLPQHTSMFHMELSSYYYLNPSSFPVPKNATHIVVGPLNAVVDPRSVRWLVYVFENIFNLVDLKTVAEESEPSDLKIELILPKIYFELSCEEDDRLPRKMVASFCTITASNYFYESTQIAETSAFDTFTDKSANYIRRFSNRLVDHVKNGQNLLMLKGEPKGSFFLVKCASLALHSEKENSSCHYPMSNAFSVNIYIAEESPSKQMICVDSLNTVQIGVDHFQFVQIRNLQLMVNELIDRIKRDRTFFGQLYSHKMEQVDLLIYALIDRTLINIVLPPTPIQSPYSKHPHSVFPYSETDESISSSSLLHSNAQNVASAGNTCTIGGATGRFGSNVLSATSPVPTTLSPTHRPETAVDSLIEETSSEFGIMDPDQYEETASIITTNSEEEIQLQVAYLNGGTGTALGAYDDIFKNAIPVAEEAIFIEENTQSNREINRYFSQVANIMEIQLNDTNVVVSLENDDLLANGYATNVTVNERMKVRCGDIIRPNNACGKPSTIPDGHQLGEKAKFTLTTHDGRTEIKIGLTEMDIDLSDIIVSHLSPFFQVDPRKDDNFKLEVILQDSVVKVKDPQKPTPLKLTIGHLKIDDGDYEERSKEQQ